MYVPKMRDYDAADRPHQITNSEDTERLSLANPAGRLAAKNNLPITLAKNTKMMKS
jgi:hypothetical protein